MSTKYLPFSQVHTPLNHLECTVQQLYCNMYRCKMKKLWKKEEEESLKSLKYKNTNNKLFKIAI